MQLITSEVRPRRVAVLASSPENTGLLRTDIEIREIEEGLRAAQRRENFVLEKRIAVRPRDLQRTLIELEPDIVHFCGHGTKSGGLLLENDFGQVQEVTPEALADLFRLFTGKVQCVLLNACYSEAQATAISQYVPYVIGMSDAVEDYTARRFAIGFYDALGAGRGFEFAFEIACNALRLEKLHEGKPILKKNSDMFIPSLTVTTYSNLEKLSQSQLFERSEYLRSGIRLFPERWLQYLELGLIQLHCKNFDNSLYLLRSAVEKAPEAADTHYYLALASFRGRQPKELDVTTATSIETYLRRATAIDSTRSSYFYLWAVLKYGFWFLNGTVVPPPSFDELFRRARELRHEPDETERILYSVPLVEERLVLVLRRKNSF